jgi:hypothetical protein
MKKDKGQKAKRRLFSAWATLPSPPSKVHPLSVAATLWRVRRRRLASGTDLGR